MTDETREKLREIVETIALVERDGDCTGRTAALRVIARHVRAILEAEEESGAECHGGPSNNPLSHPYDIMYAAVWRAANLLSNRREGDAATDGLYKELDRLLNEHAPHWYDWAHHDGEQTRWMRGLSTKSAPTSSELVDEEDAAPEPEPEEGEPEEVARPEWLDAELSNLRARFVRAEERIERLAKDLTTFEETMVRQVGRMEERIEALEEWAKQHMDASHVPLAEQVRTLVLEVFGRTPEPDSEPEPEHIDLERPLQYPDGAIGWEGPERYEGGESGALLYGELRPSGAPSWSDLTPAYRERWNRVATRLRAPTKLHTTEEGDDG